MLCATDIFGPLPTARAGVKYIQVVLDVFSKYVKLYALRSATTRACLNKITQHYAIEVVKPKRILSDNGTNFSSPLWRSKLKELGIEVMFTPIRRPQANPSKRYMREIGKFCRIYCHRNHRKWPELLGKIEDWLNGTVSSSTGYTPIELMLGKPKPDLFQRIVAKSADQKSQEESAEDKALKAFLQMKLKAESRDRKRKLGRATWNPQVDDRVLVKRQNISNAEANTTSKFTELFEGSFRITRLIPPSAYEVTGQDGRVRGVFNKQALKAYLRHE
jgi:DNA polymerase elongation subunit (family B)